jgi:putative oxygen-independent coproporphyrinogen III oxidase
LNFMAESDKSRGEIAQAAYVHIPFCRRRCYYCDFPISVVGDRAWGSNSSKIADYVDILCQEIAITPVAGRFLTTVFFGGGTPSLLSVQQLEQILAALDRRFGILGGAEISMEVDPGTFTLEQLRGYQAAGVNRVSLGVQAFQESLLQICGRSHSIADIFAAVEMIRQVGVAEFSLDLISGLPHQTLAEWQSSLAAAVAIAPTHISTYDLTIEPGTVFGRYYQPGSLPLPADGTTAQMYSLTAEFLASAGYQHYEISNYAQPHHQCRHNRVYWENCPYYGFGMGATSYTNGQRFSRPRKTGEYYQWVEQLIAVGGQIDCLVTPQEEVLLETLMLGLRLAEGLSLATLQEQFGAPALQQIWQCLQPYYHQDWVEVTDLDLVPISAVEQLPTLGRLRLTDPEGFLFSNTILATLFQQDFTTLMP